MIVIFCEVQAVAYWSRNYATRRKVAGSRPDEMNEFFLFYLILQASLGRWGLLSL
jgi:hypothetical protein